MSFFDFLSPDVQNYWVGASQNMIGGIAAEFTLAMLRVAGSRIRNKFVEPEKNQALKRAVAAALSAALEEIPLTVEEEMHYTDLFKEWLLAPVVLSEFRSLLSPNADILPDVELLQEEFEATGFDADFLGKLNFPRLVQRMVGTFYVSVSSEESLHDTIELGLLRQIADQIGALRLLTQEQTNVVRRSLAVHERLVLLAEQAGDDRSKQTELLQELVILLEDVLRQQESAQQAQAYRISMQLLGQVDLLPDTSSTSSSGNDERSSLEYARISDLLTEIRDNLQRENHTSKADLEGIEKTYRQSVIDQFETLSFRGISPSGRAIALPLEDVYVELRAVADVPEDADTYSAEERRLLLDAEDGDGKREETANYLDTLRLERWRKSARRDFSALERKSIGELLADPTTQGLVILGDPGSGKTTLLHYAALRHARQSVGAVLPIFLPLAAYDDYLRRSGGNNLSLSDFFAIYYAQWQNLPGLGPLFQDILENGRALILLDGLDEVLDTTSRRFVTEQVGALMRNWQSKGNRFVITSRVVGYREAPLTGNLPHVTVLDFSRKEIEIFAHQWTRTYEIWAAGKESPIVLNRAAIEKAALLEDVKSNPSVERLATNPLLLTMLALLRRQTGKLPDRRVELYERYVRTLLDNWLDERSPGARRTSFSRFDPHKAIALLIDVAFWLQCNRPSGTARRRDLEAALEEICLRQSGLQKEQISTNERLKARQEADDFMLHVRFFAGLIAERGRDAFGFLHLTFQEYFAGRALAKMDTEEMWLAIKPHLHNPRWREPILLCCGHLGVLEQRQQWVDQLVVKILNAHSEHEEVLHRDVFLAVAVAADDVGLSSSTLAAIAERLIPLVPSKFNIVRRSAMEGLGQLARLGDRTALQTLTEALSDRALEQDLMLSVRTLLRETSLEVVRACVTAKLDDENWQVRRAAVQALGTLVSSDEGVRKDITAKLDDENWQVRIAAVQALGTLVSSDEGVRKDITAKLDDENWDVRSAAVQALALPDTENRLLDQLLPWLGANSEMSFTYRESGYRHLNLGEEIRSQLSRAYAIAVSNGKISLEIFVEMLDAVSGQLRTGAALVILSLPGGPPPDLLPKLRALFQDTRGEESWPNRLQVADMFLNDRNQVLSHRAIQTALAALNYATQPWYWIPNQRSRVHQQAIGILSKLDPIYRNDEVFYRLVRVMAESDSVAVRDAAYQACLRLVAAPDGQP